MSVLLASSQMAGMRRGHLARMRYALARRFSSAGSSSTLERMVVDEAEARAVAKAAATAAMTMSAGSGNSNLKCIQFQMHRLRASRDESVARQLHHEAQPPANATITTTSPSIMHGGEHKACARAVYLLCSRTRDA